MVPMTFRGRHFERLMNPFSAFGNVPISRKNAKRIVLTSIARRKGHATASDIRIIKLTFFMIKEVE